MSSPEFDFFVRQDQSPDRFALDCIGVLRKFPSDAPVYPAVAKLLETTAQAMDNFAPRVVIQNGEKHYIGDKPKFEDYQETSDAIYQVIFTPPQGNGLDYLRFALIDSWRDWQQMDTELEFSYVANNNTGDTYRVYQSISVATIDPSIANYSAHYYRYRDISIDEIGIIGQGDSARYPEIDSKCIEAFDAWSSSDGPLEPEVGSSHADLEPELLVQCIVNNTLFPPFS